MLHIAELVFSLSRTEQIDLSVFSQILLNPRAQLQWAISAFSP
jgi:hypothetical protein